MKEDNSNRFKNTMNEIQMKKACIGAILILLCLGTAVLFLQRKNNEAEEAKRAQKMQRIVANSFHEYETEDRYRLREQALGQTEGLIEELTAEELMAKETMEKTQAQLALEAITEAQVQANLETIAQMATETETSTEIETTILQGGRLLTSAVVPYDGALRKITCWGDSLTEGYGTLTSITIGGIAGPTMPSVLSSLTGIEVFNMGIYGELSTEIASRQGGMKMYVNNISIPEIGSVVIHDIICEDGSRLTFGIQSDANGEAWHACFDACTIAGIEGKLAYANGQYIFTRKEAGEKITLTNNTQIITPQTAERKNDILVIQIGNNGGWYENTDVLIAQYDAMILHSDFRYYIIIGDTDFESGLESDYTWETALSKAYGDHFLNMREYLSSRDRFTECQMVPTSDDLYRISIGEVPRSFKREDLSHLNAYGYWQEGLAVYHKGLELGYWN